MNKDFNLQVRFDKNLLKKLDDFCKKYGYKRSEAIRYLVRRTR